VFRIHIRWIRNWHPWVRIHNYEVIYLLPIWQYFQWYSRDSKIRTRSESYLIGLLDLDPGPKLEFMYPLIWMDPENWFEHKLYQQLFELKNNKSNIQNFS
jgi:hypothetical protein